MKSQSLLYFLSLGEEKVKNFKMEEHEYVHGQATNRAHLIYSHSLITATVIFARPLITVNNKILINHFKDRLLYYLLCTE